MSAVFSAEQLEIVRFCAVECEMQQSGEASVSAMVNAWQWALNATAEWRLPTLDDVVTLGELVEPRKNKRGFRRCAVYIGGDEGLDWRELDTAIAELCANARTTSPHDFFYRYETIHPFVDGNGRTGQILYNWMMQTLSRPRWAKNHWNDPRRKKGRGA